VTFEANSKAAGACHTCNKILQQIMVKLTWRGIWVIDGVSVWQLHMVQVLYGLMFRALVVVARCQHFEEVKTVLRSRSEALGNGRNGSSGNNECNDCIAS
jgi:hypothetical protein